MELVLRQYGRRSSLSAVVLCGEKRALKEVWDGFLMCFHQVNPLILNMRKLSYRSLPRVSRYLEKKPLVFLLSIIVLSFSPPSYAMEAPESIKYKTKHV